MNELDRPIWHALANRQHGFAQGTALALRFDPAVSPFAACRDNEPASLAALAELVPEARHAGSPAGRRGAGAAGLRAGAGRAGRPNAARGVPALLEHAAIDLGAADVDEMVELANLTRPGPFLAGTARLGRFVGFRVRGRLAAMVGERLKLGSYTEVSAVCTHPDFRGRGMAAQLSSLVIERILARGERPFLHAFADNHQAIQLYEQLGFTHRCDMNVLALAPSGRPAETSVLPQVH